MSEQSALKKFLDTRTMHPYEEDIATAFREGYKEGRAEGASAERQRILYILEDEFLAASEGMETKATLVERIRWGIMNPPSCAKCGKQFPTWYVPDYLKSQYPGKKLCWSCYDDDRRDAELTMLAKTY